MQRSQQSLIICLIHSIWRWPWMFGVGVTAHFVSVIPRPTSEEVFLVAIRRDRGLCTLPYFFGIFKTYKKRWMTMPIGSIAPSVKTATAFSKGTERERKKKHNPLRPCEILSQCCKAPCWHNMNISEKHVSDRWNLWSKALRTITKPRKNSLASSLQVILSVRLSSRRRACRRKKKIADAIEKINELSLSQKKEAMELVEQFLT